MIFEEVDGLGGGFEEASGFGLETEMDFATGVLVKGGKIRDGGGEVIDDGVAIGVGGDPRFERAWDRADAAVHADGEPRGEEIGEFEGVMESGWGAPIWGVDAFLYGTSVELAIREPIDGEGVELMFVKEGEGLGTELGASGEFGSGLAGDAEAESEPLAGSDALFDGKDFFLESGEVFRPAFTGVNIQAISEMKRRLMLDDHRARAKDLSSRRAACMRGRSISWTSWREPRLFGKVTVSSPPRCSWKSIRPPKMAGWPWASRFSSSGNQSWKPD